MATLQRKIDRKTQTKRPVGHSLDNNLTHFWKI